MKRPSHGEKGFTLIELLLVIAILALLAGIVAPQLIRFITTGEVAAANTEVTNVESAALAYYSDYDENWPPDANCLSPDYLDDTPEYNYGFDSYGKVGGDSDNAPANGAAWGTHSNVIWNSTAHEWQSIWE